MSRGRTGGLPGGVHTTYNKIEYRTETVGIAQAPIVPIGDGVACFEMLIVANPDNTATVWIGEVTDGCHIPLPAGASVTLAINHTDKVHGRAGAAGQTVHVAVATESA